MYGHYDIVWERNFAYPLFVIDKFDLIQNGLAEIVVLSYKDLHILQVSGPVTTGGILEQRLPDFISARRFFLHNRQTI